MKKRYYLLDTVSEATVGIFIMKGIELKWQVSCSLICTIRGRKTNNMIITNFLIYLLGYACCDSPFKVKDLLHTYTPWNIFGGSIW